MQAYDTNYPETVKLIEEAVDRLKETLRQEGEYDLPGIGSLKIGIDGGYRFEPLEAGVLSPELYALDSFVLPERTTAKGRKRRSLSAMVTNRKKRTTIKRSKRHYTINVSREAVNYVAAAVMAVCFYFIWGTPVDNNDTTSRQAAATINESIFSRPTTVAPATTIAPYVELTTQKADTTVQEVPTMPQATPTAPSSQKEKPVAVSETPQPVETNTETRPAGVYTIVLASAISHHNAEDFVQSLKAEGLKSATVYKRGKMVRVVYGDYATEAAAATALQDLRKRSDFAEAWILEK